ncbi:hypothetical protein O3M35_013323 [Rhynocoris fuscipes]|uniref:Uncharacterized protein n=1 Tax=Rhynocoris fuscipes TaxID=488301 RepID=A0AAW1CEQ2_9HEMI
MLLHYLTHSLVGSAISPLSSTADDERYLIRFCTTIAEECTRKNHYDDAYSLTASLLSFAHDSETKAIIQANAASAAITSGMFSDGAFHAKEAALFEPSIRCANDISLRGYCLWAASLAYQDDYTTALGIIDNALTMYVGNKELLRLR